MDDDLILNLSEGPTAGAGRAKAAKGGRWTDRVKARHIAKRKNATSNPKATSKQAASSGPSLNDNPRPMKKARTESRSNRIAEERRPLRAESSSQATKPTSNTRPLQIVSSLFTYNPKVDFEDTPRQAAVLAKPSNAPLTDRSTFLGLGLDPLIVSHLKTRMNISAPTSIQREALPPLLSSDAEDTQDRDVFIQSQTGSGKTLSFLLPILQDLLPLSSLSYIDRSIGTLAIIIAPTRELAKQISDVLEILLQLRLRPQDENSDSASTRLTRWLVSGLLIGGENRTHEKARLRKGLPILVSTPGRLLDHLQNTSSFNVGKCRWLVLDEADRLMDLGFEESIKGIVQALDGRRKLAHQAVEEGKSQEVGGWDWTRRRRTVLCSATIKENIQHLAGTTLVKPIVVKGRDNADASQADLSVQKAEGSFTPPSQLSQKYVVAPLKLRLVSLVSLLRTLLSQSSRRHGTRIIVFLSCTDSVDFHWRLLGTSSMDESSENEPERGSEDEEQDDNVNSFENKVGLKSPLLPQTMLYRLHGSLPLPLRQAALKGFISDPSKSKDIAQPHSASSSILLCTSVAARGLDLPLVRAVVQYDLPTEGGATEYVHRVGRTARVGKGGEAWSFVLPSEKEWVPWLEERIRDEKHAESEKLEGKKAKLVPASVDSVLKSGFGGKESEYEERATQVQLAFERWVLKKTDNAELARRAYQSHMRAYATHPSDEKHIFHIRNLHLGHLAKSFALRDAPGTVSQKESRPMKRPSRQTNDKKRAKAAVNGSERKSDHTIEYDTTAEKRMQVVVRRQGRLLKKGGVLMTSGTDEFQTGGGYNLDALAVS